MYKYVKIKHFVISPSNKAKKQMVETKTVIEFEQRLTGNRLWTVFSET